MIATLGSEELHITLAPGIELPARFRTSAENDTDVPEEIVCDVDGVMTTVAGVVSGAVPWSPPDPPHPPTVNNAMAKGPVGQRMRISARCGQVESADYSSVRGHSQPRIRSRSVSQCPPEERSASDLPLSAPGSPIHAQLILI